MAIEKIQEENVGEELKKNVFLTKFDYIFNFCRGYSFWPVTFGLACCAIEMMATGGARFDFSRFGYEVFRPSPRHADVMVVAGTVTKKMKPLVRRIYDQMAEPKWVIAMGSCSISGGPFKGTYNMVDGVDEFLPVDVYVPGCPPRPEALIDGLLVLKKKIIKPEITRVGQYGSFRDY